MALEKRTGSLDFSEVDGALHFYSSAVKGFCSNGVPEFCFLKFMDQFVESAYDPLAKGLKVGGWCILFGIRL